MSKWQCEFVERIWMSIVGWHKKCCKMTISKNKYAFGAQCTLAYSRNQKAMPFYWRHCMAKFHSNYFMLVTTFVYILTIGSKTHITKMRPLLPLVLLFSLHCIRYALCVFCFIQWKCHSIVFEFVLRGLHYHVEAID